MDALEGFVRNVINVIVNPLLYLLLTAGVAYFVWGVAVYIYNSENTEERKKGTQHIFWGVIGIVVMVCVIGILAIVTRTFGVELPRV